MNFDKIFLQSGNNLTVVHPKGHVVNFKMPDYFNIKDVSDDLKAITLILLFSRIDKNLINYKFTRKSAGDKIGLAFSGGVDSTAAYCLLPKDKRVLFHHKRIITSPTLYKHDNPMHVIECLPDKVLIINSDLEDIRLKYKDVAGFFTPFAFFSGFVLLVDYLKIGYLACGFMLEQAYIEYGYKYRDFHNCIFYEKWFQLFKQANLPLFFPVIPCSEVLTNKIVNTNKIFAQPCVRGKDGKSCNTCYKCFRKKLLNGSLVENYGSFSEIKRIITHRPLKQGASLIYAMNKGNFNIPELVEYKNLDLSWLENYFEYTLLSMPEEYRDYMKNELNKYTMSITDNKILENFKL